MRWPWRRERARLPYPEPKIDGRYILPEPDFRLVEIDSAADRKRHVEEMHAQWHGENPSRKCEYREDTDATDTGEYIPQPVNVNPIAGPDR